MNKIYTSQETIILNNGIVSKSTICYWWELIPIKNYMFII